MWCSCFEYVGSSKNKKINRITIWSSKSIYGYCCCPIAKSCPTICDPMNSLPCPSLSLGVCSDSCPLNQWYYVAISSSATPFSFCLQSFSGSGSFPTRWHFASGGQSIRTSAPALLRNIQGWFYLGLTGLIPLQSKGLSRVFSSTTVQRHQFFGTQPSLRSNSHIHTWLLEKTQIWWYGTLLAKWCLCFLIHCLGLS